MSIDYEAMDRLAAGWMKERKAHLSREKGFIYKHGKRVAHSVIVLRKQVLAEDTQDDALRLAAMFHDIGKGIEPHGESGAVLVRTLLAPYAPVSLVEKVAYYVQEHDRFESDDPFVCLLRDADIMDHFGAVEIIMSGQYGAYTERGIEDTLDWYREGYLAYAERTRKRIHFEISKQIYAEKVKATQEFMERLEIESRGDYPFLEKRR